MAREPADIMSRGDGTVWFDETRRRWMGNLEHGRTHDGKRRRIHVSGEGRKDVEAKLRRALTVKEDGQQLGQDRSVAESAECWFAFVLPAREPRLAPATIQGYRWSVGYIVDGLGHKRIQKLSRQDVLRWHGLKAGAGYSKQSLRSLRSALHQILDAEFLDGNINRNVAHRIGLPMTHDERMAEDEPTASTKRAMTADQANRLLAVAADHELHALFAVGISMGLRPGEILGLRWVDIDLDGGLLHVTGALHEDRIDTGPDDAGLVTVKRRGPTKTKSSRRTLKLPKIAHAALVDHRARHVDAADAEHEALIFRTSSGRPLDKANLRRTLRSLCRQADIGKWTPDELRHTCASLLLAEGVSPHHVATLLGHVDTRMIYKHYAHTVTPQPRPRRRADGRVAGVGAVYPAPSREGGSKVIGGRGGT